MSLNLNLSDKLLREILKSMKEVMNDVLDECGKKYSFDAEEAKNMMEEMLSLKKEAKKVKEEKIKRGRPKTAAEKSPKGAKGRPKKSKKTLELNENVEDDLFASLVAAASKEDDDISLESEEEAPTEGEEASVEEEVKETAVEEEVKETAVEVKEKVEKTKKEPKEKKEKVEKTKKEPKEKKEKVEKPKKEPKEKKEKVEKPKKVEEQEEEADVVKRFEFEGVKYLKSKKTGVVYNMDQDVVGKWDEKNNKIEFAECESEEEEDEYEE